MKDSKTNLNKLVENLSNISKGNTKQGEVPRKKENDQEKSARNVNRKKKVLLVGTSISKQIDQRKIEKDLDVELKVERAYCITDEANARYRDKNFKAEVPKFLEKEVFDTLVLQTGSIEITNIDVNKAVMDTKKPIEEYKREWFEKVDKDSENLFKVAEDALEQSPSLKEVLIVKRLPRFDRSSDDIIGIKSQLSVYANQAYNQIWMKKGCPKNIHVVSLDGLNSKGYLRQIIYGKTSDRNYDGVHCVGEHSVRHVSYRIVQVMKSILCRKPSQPKAHNQRKQKPANQRAGRSESDQSERYSDVVRSGHSHKTQSNNQNGSKMNKRNTVPTSNRFDVLSGSNQGNY